MAITSKQAFEIAQRELGKDFRIVACTELSDSWIFAFIWSDGTAVFLPPVQVKKSDGSCDFWDREFPDAIEGAIWLKNNGKRIPLEYLKSIENE